MSAGKVWQALIHSSAFRMSSVEPKRTILNSFWREEAKRLAAEYGVDGMRREHDEVVNGFGYLVEEFARRSQKFPPNTEAARRLERLILGALHSGDASLGVGRRLYNPDILWIRFAGRRAEIFGLAEVKSSRQAYERKPAQLLYQEDSLRRVVQEIRSSKAAGSAVKFFAKRKITVSDEFRKVLIVPAGKAKEFERPPNGWELKEMEFSYDELVFIAKHLWPKFMPEVSFGEGPLGKFEREFLQPLEEFAQIRFHNAFPDTTLRRFPTRELLYFTLATRQMPLLDEEIEFVARGVRGVGFETKVPIAPLGLKDLTDGENQFFNKFSMLCGDTSQMRNHILYFLFCLRGFSEKLVPWCRRQEVREKVRHLAEYDIVAT